ncbi:hypothetical protein ACQPU1_02295 [Clostridium paraputrificum]|uniref:hypothetical protein n=1 Tax=Clostridium paraputrificum TaxID=29363 RepID=UPI003D34F5DA
MSKIKKFLIGVGAFILGIILVRIPNQDKITTYNDANYTLEKSEEEIDSKDKEINEISGMLDKVKNNIGNLEEFIKGK